MFDPVLASREIKNSYIDYISTTFNLADRDYMRSFLETLNKEDAIAKGPYLDIGGSYKTGRTLSQLIADGEVSPKFTDLEPVPENEKELKLERPLYTHQEEALLKAKAGESLVVTTGTGSGKTESFLLPIIDHLLKEQSEHTITAGVRAIIIYPMNALANDQMKRMRALFNGYPQITYGVYNGNTEHTQSEALKEYRKTFLDERGNPLDPAENEIISREVMQQTPPNILITNYSMLEYMMLRPKDDAVFSGAQLKFIVLDEAHIYKGATGMEMSLLMRRLRARISAPDRVQYILTSATLGGKDADDQILDFAEKLCGVNFKVSGIIRSEEKNPPMISQDLFPVEMFQEINDDPSTTTAILEKHNANFAPGRPVEEQLYALCLHSKLFAVLRDCAAEPITVSQLRASLSSVGPISYEQVISFIAVCSRAELDGASLIKPRYHFFVRALEGAYITLVSPKQVYLQRKVSTFSDAGEESIAVFEAAVCTDCGRLAIVGQIDGGFLKQSTRKWPNDDADYFYLKQDSDGRLVEDGAVGGYDGSENYILCPVCGAISTEADARYHQPCEHDSKNYVKIIRADKKNQKGVICPACEFGKIRRFYLGSEAATAVLGTELFEQLPDEEIILEEENVSAPRTSIFAKKPQKRQIRRKKAQQFLCFSDSRSEAAFFATYMERSYQEFLRRRGIWHVAEKYRSSGTSTISVAAFVDELARYFETRRSFVDWDTAENQDAYKIAADSKKNAWIAVLNEMFNARRSTSLVSMGVLAFEYMKNDEVTSGIQEVYHLDAKDARALLELLVQDAVFSGAIDAGKAIDLSAAEREYVFFSPTVQKLVSVKTADNAKKSWIAGWKGRKRENGNYYTNSRMLRLTKTLGISDDDADNLLAQYWNIVFAVDTEEFSLDANDFRIRIGGLPETKFYRCKKCGRITSHNVKNQCSSVKCDGELEEFDALSAAANNHYAKLYSSDRSTPLFIKEHTAQLAKDQQTAYQEAFVQKKINALSCSTTFEMGVDVGSLETVYMRDVPPSPSNYVQRAGRAGRAKQSSAFVLTYAKLSSHDFTYYGHPESMISGKISAPIFQIENEKIINRHIFAVAISSFLSLHPEVYAGDNQTVLLNEGGYEVLKEYLNSHPSQLKELLIHSIPQRVHERMGITNFGWVGQLCGENGVLEIAVQDFRNTVKEMEREIARSRRLHNDEEAGRWARNLRIFRSAKEDNSKKKSLIDFLVRNNVLPKYGFPVDTVELLPDVNGSSKSGELQLARDLQVAIAEYAPDAEIVADGKMYVSRYIRKTPSKDVEASWELGYYCKECPSCGQPNFTKDIIPASGRECTSCHKIIQKKYWLRTLEPRMGFVAEKEVRDVPMHRPDHDYKTDDYYIGDPHRNIISKERFLVNGSEVQIESTANDSLVVIGQTQYKVCPVCGYAKEGPIKENHLNMRGYPCSNKEGKAHEYYLSHDFKTDVAKITFLSDMASDNDTMLSVLYALLEGLSREMGIERTDIKGCLFRTFVDGTMVYSIILYDAVAGGAGHVRRIVTSDGGAFQKVIKRAIEVVDLCNCDGSCYNCLRNYYNQKIHDRLDRKKAVDFLHQWIGNMELIPKEEEKTAGIEPVRLQLPEGQYCYCYVQIADYEKEYCYICDFAGLSVGDYIEVPFGRNNDRVSGKVMRIELCTADTVPFPPERTKKIIRKLPRGTSLNKPMPRDIRLIKDIFESGKVIRAGMKSGVYDFIYETVCPDCGKHRLVTGPNMNWKLHRVGVAASDDNRKRTAAIQKHLDKYGIPLQLEPDLERSFAGLPDTCFCDFEQPKLKLFSPYGGLVRSIDENCIITIEEETWDRFDPLYDNGEPEMMARIEQLKPGDTLIMQRRSGDEEEEIELLNREGKTVGWISGGLADEILKGIDKNLFTADNFRVSKVVTRQQRGGDISQALLTITFELIPAQKKDPWHWILADRLEYFCTRGSKLSIMEPGTKVFRLTNAEAAKRYGVEPQKDRCYFELTAYLLGSERGMCHQNATALQESDRLSVNRRGSISEGDAVIAVTNNSGSPIGWLGDHLSSTLVVLLDKGRAAVPVASLEKLSKLEEPFGKEYETYAVMNALVEVNPTGFEDIVPISGDAEDYSGLYPEASEEYRRLVATVKRNCPNDWLVVTDDGVLCRAVFCDKCGGLITKKYDFGFTTETGDFYLWDQIPEPDVFKMLEAEGIEITSTKYMDWCDCGQEWS